MVIVIDNYDSFVCNLARYVRQLGYKTTIFRNNQVSIQDIESLNPTHIILSPGPKTPQETGICRELIQYFYKKVPILGVCLGHQTIAAVFGATIERAIKPMHGKASKIYHDTSGIFKNLVNPLIVGRYHSLIVSDQNFPDCLSVTATSASGEIMALSHRDYPTVGVQFHPESILSECGLELIQRFLVLNI